MWETSADWHFTVPIFLSL